MDSRHGADKVEDGNMCLINFSRDFKTKSGYVIDSVKAIATDQYKFKNGVSYRKFYPVYHCDIHVLWVNFSNELEVEFFTSMSKQD